MTNLLWKELLYSLLVPLLGLGTCFSVAGCKAGSNLLGISSSISGTVHANRGWNVGGGLEPKPWTSITVPVGVALGVTVRSEFELGGAYENLAGAAIMFLPNDILKPGMPLEAAPL